METQQDEEQDTISLEETLEVLERNTKEIKESMKKAIESYQRVMMNCKEESSPFHRRKQRVHGPLKAWAIQHGIGSELSIHEFLQYVFEEYGKQKRLDISQRTVKLDEVIAHLLHRKKEEEIDLGDFFILVVDLFQPQLVKID